MDHHRELVGRIRQKLVSGNRFRKYFIYALGEILLVVVGILIALQVNNWNEGRKQNIKEEFIIERFLTDLD